MASSKKKSKFKVKRKQANENSNLNSTKSFDTTKTSSRSSSACSSGCSSSCSTANQMNEKLTSSKSSSQSNLSDISSSGFSSASTVSAFDKATFKSRSCSPSSTASVSSSNLFLLNKSDLNANKNHPTSVQSVLSEIELNKCNVLNVKSNNSKCAIKNSKIKYASENEKSFSNGENRPSKVCAYETVEDGANKAGENDLIKSDQIKCDMRSKIGSNHRPVLSSVNYYLSSLFVYIYVWLYDHLDYITILTISILINLNTLNAGFVYDDK